VRTSDLVWLVSNPLSIWKHILNREPDTRDTYERLITLPGQQEQYEADSYSEWRRQIAEGKLTEEQLRHALVTHYDPRFLDVMLDRTLHAEPYPAARAAAPFGSLYLVAAPDGLTDEFAYEFRSVGTADALERQFTAMQLLSQLDAYLLGRQTAVAHIHVRRTASDERSAEPLDAQLARDFLSKAEAMLQEISEQLAANFKPQAA